MEALKFEQLPDLVADLKNEVKEMKALILNKAETQPETENPLSIDDIVLLTGYTKPTLYGYCQKNLIPYHKKNGRLFFFKNEIIDWIKQGKQKSLSEIETEAENYLSNNNSLNK